MRFINYITERTTTKDVSWFLNLPEYKPDSFIRNIQNKFNIYVNWKYAGRSFKYSRFAYQLDLIVVCDGSDNKRVLLHELGHASYKVFNKAWIRSLTRYIKDNYKHKVKGWSYKTFRFNDEDIYAFSHSGQQYEDEEIWAILFSLYFTGYNKWPEEKIKQAIELILKGK